MVNYGKHFCKNPRSSYYAGWDGLGIDNKDACKELCKKDYLCTYAASKPGHTCSRYKGGSCELKTESEVLEEEKGHFTFKKMENTPSSPGKSEMWHTRPVILNIIYVSIGIYDLH